MRVRAARRYATSAGASRRSSQPSPFHRRQRNLRTAAYFHEVERKVTDELEASASTWDALADRAIEPAFLRGWEDVLRRVATLEPLVVAAVHSHCLGGGLQLTLACDLRVARDDARFGVTAVRAGIIPGMGMWRIARYAGLGRAKPLALTGDIVDAPTALAWGLVDYVAAADPYDATVGQVVERLLSMATTSTRLTKKLVQLAFDAPFAEFRDVFCDYQQQAIDSQEHRSAKDERRRARAERAAVASKSLRAE